MNKKTIIFIFIILIASLFGIGYYFIKNTSTKTACSLAGNTVPTPNEICCNGLKPLYGWEYMEECIAFQDTGLLICSPCGNSVCDTEYKENKCNCPDDCK